MDTKEICMQCKIISVCSLLGIGGYLIHRGRTQLAVSKYSMYFLGSVIGSLGIGEMFDKSPFR